MKNSWLKKSIILGTIIVLVGASVVPALSRNISLDSKTVNQGNTLYVGGSGPGNYTKIQDAIDNASNGDIVFVYNGTYFENIRVVKSILLIGEDRNSTIINSILNGSAITTLIDGVTIQNFTIQNSKNIGVALKSNYSKVLGNVIKNNYWAGVQIKGVSELDSQFRCHDNLISGNTITNNNFRGIYIWFTYQNTITKNVISYSKQIGIEIILSEDITISENKIVNNQYEGIYLSGVWGDNIIFANSFKNNGEGIRVDDSRTTNITQNNLENDSIILYLTTNNLISKNNFFQGSASFSYAGRSNNIWRENYWNEKRLLPKPIIGRMGDTFNHAYYPRCPWVNFDWFPAKEPNNIPGMRL